MKFWELISAFRSEKKNLNSVLDKPEWKEYKKQLQNFNEIVNQKNRKILDKEIPFQLSKEVCEKSELKFYLYYERKPQMITSWKKGTDEKFEIITPLDILLRYGGKYIEETLERSIAEVNPKPIGNDVEVLGAFNITNRGILAILRTEKDKLENGEIIYVEDEKRQWQIVEEPLIRMSPFSAYQKKESQKEQGIRDYLIKPLNNEGKPIDKEILKRKPNR